MASFDYAVVIIGSGFDGSVAALRAAQDFTVDEPWHQYPIGGHLLSISVPGGSGLRERRLK